MHQIEKDDAEGFIAKWLGVGASESSTSPGFLADSRRLLGVPVPRPTPELDCMFERSVTFTHGDSATSTGCIDLCRRGIFLLESKKLMAEVGGKDFDKAPLRARSQAAGYARALPVVQDGRYARGA